MKEQENETYDDFLRSDAWRHVRNGFLSEHPTCFVCGSGKAKEVHHIQYDSKQYSGMLSTDNLRPLCDGCHELVHQFEHEITFEWLTRGYVPDKAVSYKLLIYKQRVKDLDDNDQRDYLKRLVFCINSNVLMKQIKREDGTHRMVISELKKQIDLGYWR